VAVGIVLDYQIRILFQDREEMKQLFTDLPEAISNLSEIVDKIEIYNLAREVCCKI
jgi:DNA polymerase III alpha subunit